MRFFFNKIIRMLSTLSGISGIAMLITGILLSFQSYPVEATNSSLFGQAGADVSQVQVCTPPADWGQTVRLESPRRSSQEWSFTVDEPEMDVTLEIFYYQDYDRNGCPDDCSTGECQQDETGVADTPLGSIQVNDGQEGAHAGSDSLTGRLSQGVYQVTFRVTGRGSINVGFRARTAPIPTPPPPTDTPEPTATPTQPTITPTDEGTPPGQTPTATYTPQTATPTSTALPPTTSPTPTFTATPTDEPPSPTVLPPNPTPTPTPGTPPDDGEPTPPPTLPPPTDTPEPSATPTQPTITPTDEGTPPGQTPTFTATPTDEPPGPTVLPPNPTPTPTPGTPPDDGEPTPPPTLPPPAPPANVTQPPVLIPVTGADLSRQMAVVPSGKNNSVLPSLLINIGITLLGFGLVVFGFTRYFNRSNS